MGNAPEVHWAGIQWQDPRPWEALPYLLLALPGLSFSITANFSPNHNHPVCYKYQIAWFKKKWNLGCITYYQVQSLTLSDKKLTLGYLLLKQKARYSIAGDAGPVSDSSVHVDVVMAAKEPWQYLALLATAWRFYLGGSLRRHSIFLVESQSPITGMHDGEYIRAHGTLHMSTKKVHRHQSMDPDGQAAYQSQLGRWENMEP